MPNDTSVSCGRSTASFAIFIGAAATSSAGITRTRAPSRKPGDAVGDDTLHAVEPRAHGGIVTRQECHAHLETPRALARVIEREHHAGIAVAERERGKRDQRDGVAAARCDLDARRDAREERGIARLHGDLHVKRARRGGGRCCDLRDAAVESHAGVSVRFDTRGVSEPQPHDVAIRHADPHDPALRRAS